MTNPDVRTIFESIEFSLEGINNFMKIDVDGNRVCGLSRTKNSLIFFIEADVPQIDEKFNGMRVTNAERSIVGYPTCSGVELVSPVKYQSQFVLICYDMMSAINAGGDIEEVCSNWKELLGNRYSKPRIYDVIGELMALTFLASRGYDVSWEGPVHGRHDIQTESFDCEVKSTTVRSGAYTIHSSSEDQFINNNRPLKLFYFRFEESPKGSISINALITYLESLPTDISDIKEKLQMTGITSERDLGKKFDLVGPFHIYDVDKNFPVINRDTIDGIPSEIVDIQYTIVLDGIEHSTVSVFYDEGSFEFSDE